MQAFADQRGRAARHLDTSGRSGFAGQDNGGGESGQSAGFRLYLERLVSQLHLLDLVEDMTEVVNRD